MTELLPSHDFKISYAPGDQHLEDFYIPALSLCIAYDRSAGYFSSSALSCVARGIVALIKNNGKMRLLVGAQLSEADAEAIQLGHAALEKKVAENFLRELENIEQALEKGKREALAWMIAKGMLEIQVVLPTDKHGRPIPAPSSDAYFHMKEGVFRDQEGNRIAFTGSINESQTALENNYESFSVYKSWDVSRPYLEQVEFRFNRLWEHKENDWVALPIPQAVKDRLLKYTPDRSPASEPEPEKPKPDDDPFRLRPQVTPGRLPFDQEKKPKEIDQAEMERILFQFVKDAPLMPNATDLGMATSAVEVWPHQRRVVRTIVDKYPERFMLCDEVGLGKTIEAGLVIRQLIISRRVKRCLILAPKSVLRQWQEELYEKFILDVPMYDGHIFKNVLGEELDWSAENPWNAFSVILAGSQLAKRTERQSEILQADRWDLLVVDEAHHARRKDFLDISRYRPNRLLELLEKLKDRTEGMLLLTATPMQIDPVEVWDLLRLLGMGGKWGANQKSFKNYFQELSLPADSSNWSFQLDMLGDFFKTGGELDQRFSEHAEKVIGPVQWATVRDLYKAQNRDMTLKQLSPEARQALREMLRRHTPIRRFIFRNTRNLLRKYHEQGILKEKVPHRQAKSCFINMTIAEQELYERIDEYIRDFYKKYEAERKGLGFIMTVYRRRLTSSFYALEESLKRRRDFLKGKISSWPDDDDIEQEELELDISDEISKPTDDFFADEVGYIDDFLTAIKQIGTESKVGWLLDELNRFFQKRDKVIIFTQYTDTMDFLREQLLESYGSQIACYSGIGGERWNGSSWEVTTKEEIKNEFKTGDKIKILICSPAASEGLNLQTCGVLINYDVPWNPMMVEQRIGRIDRIGQKYDAIWVRNCFYEDTVEADVYHRLDERITSFESVVGALQPILGRVERLIKVAAMSSKKERSDIIKQQVDEINQDLESKNSELWDLDKLVDDEIEEIGEDRLPLDLEKLKNLFLESPKFKSFFTPDPKLPGAFRLDFGGKVRSVTFDPRLFDQYPNTLHLLSYADPVLQMLLDESEPPVPNKNGGRLARCMEIQPVERVVYFSAVSQKESLVEKLNELSVVLKSGDSTITMGPVLEKIQANFRRGSGYLASNLHRGTLAKHNAELLAFEERAKSLLLGAAYIELAKGQLGDLFSQDSPTDFSVQAVKNLKKHGTPFRGLLSLVDTDTLKLSQASEEYELMRKYDQHRLDKQFNAIKTEATEVLIKLVAFRKLVPGKATAEGDTVQLLSPEPMGD